MAGARVDRDRAQLVAQAGVLALLHRTEDAEAAIRRHGIETYPNECCGALIASTVERVEQAVAGADVVVSYWARELAEWL